MDWAIVVVGVGALTCFALWSTRYMRGVTDFLSANRSAGRFMIAMAGSAVGICVISVVGYFEQFYAAGLPTIWWTWMVIPASIVITLTGWVVYRFRETRCLTLAQFFEVRYSRRFRIFAGMIIWLSGILNFGIFPYVAGNFFVYYCGLPDRLTLLGASIPTYWPVMALTLGLALFYTLIGGHVTVMVTDCLQGLYVNAIFLLLCVMFLGQYAWPEIVHAMREAPVIATRAELEREAQRKSQAHENAVRQGLAEEAARLAKERDALLAKVRDEVALRQEARGRSMLNPFDTGRVKDFSLWFFLILVFNSFYGMLSWQGSSAYQCAAVTPHEQKMGGIIFNWLYALRMVGLVTMTLAALTFLTHPKFAGQSAAARAVLERLAGGDTPQLAVQQRVPVALRFMLPVGLRGLFCLWGVFLLITTQDTYLHSWGSIFIQDVVLPFRKRPLTPEQHVNWLRWSIAGVAIFSFFFACFYRPSEFIQMYFAITGAIISGLGCAIIGGLYWRYGGTLAAYVAVGLGAVLSVARIVAQYFTEQIAAMPRKGVFLRFLDYTNTRVNSQYVWFWIMVVCIVAYVVLSLVTARRPFDLERMLHRGEYDTKGEHRAAADAVRSAWLRIVGITQEFTRTDRLLAFALVLWNGVWMVLFFGAAAYNFLLAPIPDAWWSAFWRIWLWVQVAVGALAYLWFCVGCAGDIRRVFGRLATLQRDDTDDGRVTQHVVPGNQDAAADMEKVAR